MRLIDADALLEGIAELKQSPWFNNKYGYADRKDAVESIEYLCIKKEPTIDAVEVVRCKDCKYFVTNYAVLHCGRTLIGMEKSDFCSYGERKQE